MSPNCHPLTTGRGNLLLPLLGTTFLLFTVAELGTRLLPRLGYVGVAAWVVAYGALLWLAARYLVDSLARRAWDARWPTLLALAAASASILSGVGDPRSVSFEATDATACAARLLSRAADGGFHGSCLWGFPAQGFYPQALPALLFERTPFLVNVPYALLVVVGLVLFARGLETAGGALPEDRVAARRIGWLTALLVPALLHVHSFNEFLFSYDHASAPTALGLAFWGFFLHSRRGVDAVDVTAAFLVLLLSLRAYAPALFTVAIGFPVLVYYGWNGAASPKARRWLLVMAVLFVACALSTLTHRLDLTGQTTSPLLGMLLERNLFLLEEALYLKGTSGVHTVPMALLTVGTLAAALLGFVGRRGVVMALVILGIFVVAVSSRGTYAHGVMYDFQRGRAAYPVLLILAFLVLARLFQRLPARASWLLPAGAALMVILGVYQQQTFRSRQRRDYRVEWAAGWLKDRIADRTLPRASVLLLENDLWTMLAPIHDATVYFAPEITVRFLNERCELPPAQLEKEIFLLATPKGTCADLLQRWTRARELELELSPHGVRPYVLWRDRGALGEF